MPGSPAGAWPCRWTGTLDQRDWRDRTEAYLGAATALFGRVANRALQEAGLRADEIDVVVTVSSTGIATPTLDARAGPGLGLRPDVARVPVFGLGCAGGVTGLSLAARLALSQPGTRVLLVAVELCSIAFRLDRLTKANIVATALFGDGAAAAVVCSGDGGNRGAVEIDVGFEYQWPETLGIMGWNVDPIGFDVVFDRAIPPFTRRHFGSAFTIMLDRLGLDMTSLARLSFHPGGTKVLEAIEGALDLGAGQLDVERAVLHDHGNMSAPTALFVLQRVLCAAQPGISLLSALGPGFTASTVPVTVRS